jgi:hypothetical protein
MKLGLRVQCNIDGCIPLRGKQFNLLLFTLNLYIMRNFIKDKANLCRYLRKLKNNVKNKAKVEGSICNAYLVEEGSSFCAHYFEPHVNTRIERCRVTMMVENM